MSEISILNGYKIKDKKAVRYYDNVTAMKNDTTLKENMYVKTNGFYDVDDGGYAEYLIRQSSIDDTIDNAFIISLNNNLVAELKIKDKILLSTLGCKKGDSEQATNIIDLALNYVNSNKEITLIIDDSYTFDEIDLTDINYIKIEGTNESNRILINNSIIIPSNHNNFENLNFELQTDTTLLNITGKYNNFTNCKFFGKNNHTGIGVNVSSYVNTFINCSFREFKKCVIVSNNEINFINCNIIGNDDPLEGENTVNITDGLNINFTNCDIEKGYNIINITGGLSNFNGCYIEGASSRYHIMLIDGNTNIINNYLHNIRIGKYADAKLTCMNNTIEKSIAEDYSIYPLEQNIGYLVIINNKLTDSNGYIINIDNIRGKGITPPCPRYYNGSTWVTGTRNDYICIIQERCYEFGTGNGVLTAEILPIFKPNSGSTYHRTFDAINSLIRGDTYFDTTLNKLLVKTDSGWVDCNGNAIND